MNESLLQLTHVDDDAQWDHAASRLSGYSFFESSAWLKEFSYKVDRLHRMLFARGSEIVAAVAWGECRVEGRLHYSVPFSASYGGVMFRPLLGVIDTLAVVENWLAYLRTLSAGTPFILSYRQRPRTAAASVRYGLEEFALLKNGFHLADLQLDYDVDLSSISYSKTKRHEFTKASRVLRFGQADMRVFVDFQNMILMQQPEKIKTMPDEELLRIEVKFPDTVQIFAATLADEPIAVLLSAKLTDKIALARNWFHDQRYAHHCATFFLVASWLEWLRAQKYERACLGGTALLSWPVSTGHALFKEHFRPEADLQRRYVYESLPNDHAEAAEGPKA